LQTPWHTFANTPSHHPVPRLIPTTTHQVRTLPNSHSPPPSPSPSPRCRPSLSLIPPSSRKRRTPPPSPGSPGAHPRATRSPPPSLRCRRTEWRLFLAKEGERRRFVVKEGKVAAGSAWVRSARHHRTAPGPAAARCPHALHHRPPLQRESRKIYNLFLHRPASTTASSRDERTRTLLSRPALPPASLR
jgi:hypothetical protein